MGAMVMPSQEIELLPLPGSGTDPEQSGAAATAGVAVEGDWFMKRGGWRKVRC